MKKLLVLVLLAFAFNADAQSLKDLLYSGKLKKDSSGVIRKTDDLSTKIDTVQRKDSVVVKKSEDLGKVDSVDTVDRVDNGNKVDNGDAVQEEEVDNPVVVDEVKAAPVKSNTKIWREYTDSLSTALKTEILSNKKVKKGTYFFIVDYEIDENGQTSINKVTVSPENETLLIYVRERMLVIPPALNVVMDSSNKPRKVKRKQSFTITKE